MIVIKTISQMHDFLKKEKSFANNFTLIPTMGALHDGHLSLIKKAKEISKNVIVTIFVNKTQFNDINDYKKYPKTPTQDLKKLELEMVDAVFMPDDYEMFLSDFSFKITPTNLVDCLCGKSRIGHFDGVALIITKLFNLLKPRYAIFGEKDFQQLLIIKRLVRDLNFDVEIISHPIVRMENGLAMSSRNQRLSDLAIKTAANLFRILNEIKQDPNQISRKYEELLKVGFEKIDYLEIRSEENLEIIDISKINLNIPCRIFVAAYIENVRLIDNLKLY